MAAARARVRRSRLDRARRRSRRRDRRGGGPAGGLGRRHPRAQGDADQLSSLGRDRRRPAGRHRGGARRRTCSGRPACIGCCSSCSACRSRSTGTTASCSTTTGRSCRSRPAATGLRELRAAGRDARRHPPSGRPGLDRGRQSLQTVRTNTPLRRDSARARHGMVGPAGSGESWRQNRAHSARRGRSKKRPSKKRAPARAAGKARKRAAMAAAPGMVEAALAAFAHEVRTPLTGILAISDLLATSDLDERERRWVDTIKAGAEHLASLATLFVDAARSRGRRAWRAAGLLRSARARPQRRGFAGRPGDRQGPAIRRSRFPKNCRRS